MSDSWGAWQAVHSPAETGPCMCGKLVLSSWHDTQRSFKGWVSSLGSLDAWGS